MTRDQAVSLEERLRNIQYYILKSEKKNAAGFLDSANYSLITFEQRNK